MNARSNRWILPVIDFRKSNRTFTEINTANAPTSCRKIQQSITNALVCSLLFLGLVASGNAEVIQTEIDVEQAIGIKGTEGSSSSRGRRIEVKPVNEMAVLSPDEQQMIKINQSLKNSVEENKKLIEERNSVESELKRLRGEQEIRENRIRTLTSHRDGLTQRAEKAEQLQKQFGDELNQLKTTSTQKETEYSAKIKVLEKESAEKKEIEEVIPWSKAIIQDLKVSPETAAGAPQDLGTENLKLKIDSAKLVQDLKKQAQANLKGMESNIKKVSAKISELKAENQKLKIDSAKLHYNLGNVLFEQQKFDQAAKEYKKVVELTPHDPAAHYNLAFVSGDLLKDYDTAKVHYERYLALNPNAEDAYLVKEKLLEISLLIRTNIGPPLEKKIGVITGSTEK